MSIGGFAFSSSMPNSSTINPTTSIVPQFSLRHGWSRATSSPPKSSSGPSHPTLGADHAAGGAGGAGGPPPGGYQRRDGLFGPETEPLDEWAAMLD